MTNSPDNTTIRVTKRTRMLIKVAASLSGETLNSFLHGITLKYLESFDEEMVAEMLRKRVEKAKEAFEVNKK